MLAQAWQVEKSIGAALTLLLKLPGAGDVRRDAGAAFAIAGNRGQGRGLAGNGQVQVDAVEQGAGELVAVALDLIAATTAAPAGVAEISTGAGVHRRDQLEACRKADLVLGPGDDDFAGLQWLAQHFQYPPFKFRQLPMGVVLLSVIDKLRSCP